MMFRDEFDKPTPSATASSLPHTAPISPALPSGPGTQSGTPGSEEHKRAAVRAAPTREGPALLRSGPDSVTTSDAMRAASSGEIHRLLR